MFTFNADLTDLSEEFKAKWSVDPNQFPEEEQIEIPAGPKEIDEKSEKDPNYEGYCSITLVFEKYFEL